MSTDWDRIVVGFDIDETITYHPELFRALAAMHLAAEHKVVVVTFREDIRATCDFLVEEMSFNDFHQVITSDHPRYGVRDGEDLHAWKARVIVEQGITLMYEDALEVVALLPDHVKVLLPVDPVNRGWMRTQLGR